MKTSTAKFRISSAASAILLVLATAGCASAPPVEQTYPILGKVLLQADIVRGSKAPAGAVCAYESQYMRGEEIVPRVKVLDPKSEQYLTDKEMKSVKFVLRDGTTVPMHFGPHPGAPKEPTDTFWTGGWQIPDNYPTGASGWWIEAETNDGRKGRFDPPKVASNALTILERTIPK